VNAAVNIRNLGFSYRDTPVLEDLSFNVRQGDFFIIIGPNGSGKTTLLKNMAGLVKVQAGRVDILGRQIQRYKRKALAKQIAYVPQTGPGDLPYRVADLVLMGRSPYLGMLGMEGEADLAIAGQAMAFTGVDHLAARPLSQLSGGEQQRVSIARAICQEPEIILLDEPTASLDLAHQVNVMDLMESLKNDKGITVIMVSHDINLAAMYGDNLLLLNKGQAVTLGPPGEVLTYPTLEEAYGCKLLLDENPVGKTPRISLVPGRYL
jgi:iron complex transport system ATP-binding protein